MTEETAARTALDEKMDELSAEQRELLELLLGSRAAPPVEGSPRVPPRNEREARLAAIWQEIVGVEEIGVEDDFFALGGDSLHAIRIVSRARREGFELTTADIFERRTVAALAPLAAAEPPSEPPTETPSEPAGEFADSGLNAEQLRGLLARHSGER